MTDSAKKLELWCAEVEQAMEKLRIWKRNAAGHRLRVTVYVPA